jgi:hypothetical protein
MFEGLVNLLPILKELAGTYVSQCGVTRNQKKIFDHQIETLQKF